MDDSYHKKPEPLTSSTTPSPVLPGFVWHFIRGWIPRSERANETVIQASHGGRRVLDAVAAIGHELQGRASGPVARQEEEAEIDQHAREIEDKVRERKKRLDLDLEHANSELEGLDDGIAATQESIEAILTELVNPKLPGGRKEALLDKLADADNLTDPKQQEDTKRAILNDLADPKLIKDRKDNLIDSVFDNQNTLKKLETRVAETEAKIERAYQDFEKWMRDLEYQELGEAVKSVMPGGAFLRKDSSMFEKAMELGGFLGKASRPGKAATALKKLNRSRVIIQDIRKTTTVYWSINKQKRIVNYVGITSRFAQRKLEHLREKGINIRPLIEGLKSRKDARCVEQALIKTYGLRKKLKTVPAWQKEGTLINEINSISSKHPEYAKRLKRGFELLKKHNIDVTRIE